MSASAKRRGQELSLLDLLADDVERFLAIVASVEPGREVSVNTVRETLDGWGIPDKARGGLFHRAVADGLLEPLFTDHAGHKIRVKVPSSGTSARHAVVGVYVRTDRVEVSSC